MSLNFYFIAAPLLFYDIHPDDRWAQNGITVAGGDWPGSNLNQLFKPHGLYVDDDQTLYIADYHNHRIVEWTFGATSGRVIFSGSRRIEQNDQIGYPTDVILSKETNSLISCGLVNSGAVRWPLRDGTNGQEIISNVSCRGLTMDDKGFLYVSDYMRNEVRRWRLGETEGAVVAGGNGEGDRLDQLHYPTYVFVDRNQSLYVSDTSNHRVMKWTKGAKKGIVVAGGQDEGCAPTQLHSPGAVTVDQLGTVYVADSANHRIMCWPQGATIGSTIVGGNGRGNQANQLHHPIGLSFDRQGNLYVADSRNHRVQRFSINVLS